MRRRSGFVLLLLVAAAVAFALGRYTLHRTLMSRPSVQAGPLLTMVRNVLRLGVLEINLSQIYEVSKENLEVSSVPVPFTNQQILLAVTGSALYGYDVDKAELRWDPSLKVLMIALPEPEVLSLDVDFRFLQEQDTFLNRIRPEDRNQIMKDIRRRVRAELQSSKRRRQVAERVRGLIRDAERTWRLKIRIREDGA